MLNTSTHIKKFFFLALPSFLLTLVFLEFVVFRSILPASDWPTRTSIETPDDVVRRVPGKGVYRRGFPGEIRAAHSNNLAGWNASREYVELKSTKKRIAVIGDSFVEAYQVDTDKAFAEVLEKDLIEHTGPNLEVYRFGYSGAPLSQYLHMVRYVNKKYHPDIVVINIAANDFLASIHGQGESKGDFLQFARKDSAWLEVKPDPHNTTFLRTRLKHSAMVRYLYLNLYLNERIYKFQSLFKPKPDFQMYVEIDKEIENLELLRNLCLHIFMQFKATLGPDVKLLLVMDADRSCIYRGDNPEKQKSNLLTGMVRHAGRQLSIPFIDLTDAFISDYRINKEAFDFKNDGHWNERAHSVVGKTISKFIQDQKW